MPTMPDVKLFIEHWGLSKSILANETSMSQSALYNKFNAAEAVANGNKPASRDKFTPEQEREVVDYLTKLRDDLNQLLAE